MNRRDAAVAFFVLGITSAPFTSFAQRKDKLWRVGIVYGGTRATVKANEEAFLKGMTDHGYYVGRNLIVDSRYAGGDAARYPVLVDEVIALKPDVLIGANTDVSI